MSVSKNLIMNLNWQIWDKFPNRIDQVLPIIQMRKVKCLNIFLMKINNFSRNWFIIDPGKQIKLQLFMVQLLLRWSLKLLNKLIIMIKQSPNHLSKAIISSFKLKKLRSAHQNLIVKICNNLDLTVQNLIVYNYHLIIKYNWIILQLIKIKVNLMLWFLFRIKILLKVKRI